MNNQKERGFTLIELSILVAIINIIAAIAVPRLLSTRMNANETSAIATLKVTASAQVAYSIVCGDGAYAASFVVLGTAPPGGTGFVSADLGKFAAPQKNGYNFTLGAGAGAAAGPKDCNGTGTITAYLATASPMTDPMTGTRSFALNAGNTVWQLAGSKAPKEPFGAPATPIQ